MRSWRPALLAMTCCATAASPAVAAGGAHVVDDSAVEDAGVCHVESWLTLGSHAGLVNLAPACTPKAIPALELGGSVIHDWFGHGSATLAGLAAKINLRSEYRGLGVAIDAAAGMATDQHHLDNASLIVPLTIPASTSVRLNFNLGWQWTRAAGNAAFAGAQAEIAVAHDLGLMVEGFGHDQGKAGAQAGLRWNPHRGKVDLDLIGGRYVDGVTATSVTMGLTLRI